jgi:hypothetical protein
MNVCPYVSAVVFMFNLKFNKNLSIIQGRTRLGGVTLIWFLTLKGHEDPPAFVFFVVPDNPGFARVETHVWKGKTQTLWEAESAVAVFFRCGTLIAYIFRKIGFRQMMMTDSDSRRSKKQARDTGK